MAEKSTDKTPASKGESPEPKRLYVAFYDPYTKENDQAFERAAKTWKAGIDSTGYGKDTTLTVEDLGKLRDMPLHPKAYITLTGCNRFSHSVRCLS